MPEEPTRSDLAELRRKNLEALNRGDFAAVESFYAPDAVYVGTEIGTFEGAAAMRGLVEDFTKPYVDFHAETEEFIAVGNGVTFSVNIFTGHPLSSSGEVRLRFASVGIWTDGLIERQTDYMDIDDARKDAEWLAGSRE